jgi:phosphoglycolate phosphatase
MNNERHHLIIFDLDGTLVDSRDDIVASINHALQSVDEAPHTRERLVRQIGRPLSLIFDELMENPSRAEEAADIYRTFFFDHCADHSALYPGVSDLLPLVHKVAYTSIGTTKRTFMAVRVAQLLGFEAHLDYIQGTDDFPAKPDPTLLLNLMARFGIPAERTLMVGDTPTDILAGQAAGAHTVAVRYGIGDTEALEAAGPEYMVDNIMDLRSILHTLWGIEP